MIVLTTLTPNHRRLFRLLILLAVFTLGVPRAAAIPLSEYHDLLVHIVEDLESLRSLDEDESTTDFEYRFIETITAMRSEFPKSQQVELEGGAWTTDNTWFHLALDDLQQSPAELRASKLEGMAQSITALQQRATELRDARKVPGDKAAEKQKLESILSRPEYAGGAKGSNAITRLIEDFIRWFRGLFPEMPEISPGRASVVSVIVRIIVVLLCLAAISYAAVLLLRRFKFERKTKTSKKKEPRIVLGERLNPEDTATDLLAEAEALARSGDLRAAIRKGYIALLVELGDRKLISLAQYKTNRDYLTSVRNSPQLHSRLKGLTDSFERHWYGFVQATPNDWQDFRTGYRDALQTGN